MLEVMTPPLPSLFLELSARVIDSKPSSVIEDYKSRL